MGYAAAWRLVLWLERPGLPDVRSGRWNALYRKSHDWLLQMKCQVFLKQNT